MSADASLDRCRPGRSQAEQPGQPVFSPAMRSSKDVEFIGRDLGALRGLLPLVGNLSQMGRPESGDRTTGDRRSSVIYRENRKPVAPDTSLKRLPVGAQQLLLLPITPIAIRSDRPNRRESGHTYLTRVYANTLKMFNFRETSKALI